jgi:hypothetical protein|nr:hypothetical protein [Pseudomonadales bacterium]
MTYMNTLTGRAAALADEIERLEELAGASLEDQREIIRAEVRAELQPALDAAQNAAEAWHRAAINHKLRADALAAAIFGDIAIDGVEAFRRMIDGQLLAGEYAAKLTQERAAVAELRAAAKENADAAAQADRRDRWRQESEEDRMADLLAVREAINKAIRRERGR